jgi:nucleotide-binding universal stress UspA family protein
VTSDLSPASADILRALSPLLNGGGFDVTLLHVHEWAPAGRDHAMEMRAHEAALAELRDLLPESTPVDCLVHEIARGGGVDTAILETARDLNAQAIAMSTHGHSARHELLMGSVALSVLARSVVPLIVTSA